MIVNHNSAQLTRDCIARLQCAGLPPAQVIVVDNASSDGSTEHLAEHMPAANLIEAEGNRGFAAGCNLGASAAFDRDADAVLMINADTGFARDFLQRLLPPVDLVDACHAPEIFRMDDRDRLWFAGAWRGRLPGRLHLRRSGDPRTEVDYLWACCLLIGRRVWHKVGAFDSRFFLYYEDMDWCDRARRVGVVPRIVPGARLYHIIGATLGGPDTPKRRYHMTRSGVLYAHGVRSAGGRELGAGAIRTAIDMRAALRLALRGDRAGLAAHRAGWRDGWRLAQARQTAQGHPAAQAHQRPADPS